MLKKWSVVPISGYDVKIIYTDLGLALYGEYNPNNRTIYLNTNKKCHWTHATLLHEIIHAIFDINGVSVLLPKKYEEMIVVVLENALKPLIRFIF